MLYLDFQFHSIQYQYTKYTNEVFTEDCELLDVFFKRALTPLMVWSNKENSHLKIFSGLAVSKKQLSFMENIFKHQFLFYAKHNDAHTFTYNVGGHTGVIPFWWNKIISIYKLFLDIQRKLFLHRSYYHSNLILWVIKTRVGDCVWNQLGTKNIKLGSEIHDYQWRLVGPKAYFIEPYVISPIWSDTKQKKVWYLTLGAKPGRCKTSHAFCIYQWTVLTFRTDKTPGTIPVWAR